MLNFLRTMFICFCSNLRNNLLRRIVNSCHWNCVINQRLSQDNIFSRTLTHFSHHLLTLFSSLIFSLLHFYIIFLFSNILIHLLFFTLILQSQHISTIVPEWEERQYQHHQYIQMIQIHWKHLQEKYRNYYILDFILIESIILYTFNMKFIYWLFINLILFYS